MTKSTQPGLFVASESRQHYIGCAVRHAITDSDGESAHECKQMWSRFDVQDRQDKHVRLYIRTIRIGTADNLTIAPFFL